jgi:acyl transferase domain-containing protein
MPQPNTTPHQQPPNTGRDRPDGSKFRCIIASGKSNIGHLEAAAGVMGLIRASLILYHGKVRALCVYSPSRLIDRSPSLFLSLLLI